MTHPAATTVPTITLHDGHVMPQLGYGVWLVADDVAERSVQQAIDAGYRSIDTATIYENEAGVGRAIRACSVPRDELFVTTKLWNSAHAFDDALRAFETSLDLLALDHVDLYLIHWPAPATGNFREAWRALIEIKSRGLARSIGVSNFGIADLEVLAREFDEQPVINQVEAHPYFQQHELRAYCFEHDIALEAWSPLGQGGALLADPVIAELAERHGCTPAQIILRWHIQRGHVVIPKSVTPARIIENISIFDIELSPGDMAAIEALDRADGRIGPNPATATF